MSYAVVVRDLTKQFGEFTAVDHISFDVREGEVFGFLGPNGAGKTTTIKMLTGLVLPTSGEGHVAGFDVRTETEAIRRNIGYMSQAFSLYGDLTADENITFFAGLYDVTGERREQRRAWVLEMADLREQKSRLVRELSLGWKQRLALGCAVLHEPPILFLDEPTSGVDPISRRNFWDLIYDLAGRGTTVFVTTHYMEEAEYCNRLALMNRGRIVACDEPATLRASMSEPLLEIELDHGVEAIAVIRDHPRVIEAGLYGRAIHVTVDDAARATTELGDTLAAHGFSSARISTIPPALEDVFVSLIHSTGGAIDG